MAALDQREADDLRLLQEQLAPRARVRIFRARPTWAAGWVEDLSLRNGVVGELLEYLRDEHGGQDYTIQVLGRDGQTVLYESELPIAGMVRRRGKPCTRDQWEGIETDVVKPQPTAAAVSPALGFDPFQMFDRMVTMQSEAAKSTRELVDKLHTNTMDLVESALEQKTTREKQGSPVEQIRELVTLKRELDDAHAELGGSEKPAAAPVQTEDDVFKSVAKDVLKTAFMGEKKAPAGLRRVMVRRNGATETTQATTQTQATQPAANGGVERLVRRTQASTPTIQ